MSEILELLASFLEEMPDAEFEAKLSESGLLRQFEPLLFLVPEDYKKQAKKLKFPEIKKFFEKRLSEKAKIIAKLKKWEMLEKEFERLKKKL